MQGFECHHLQVGVVGAISKVNREHQQSRPHIRPCTRLLPFIQTKERHFVFLDESKETLQAAGNLAWGAGSKMYRGPSRTCRCTQTLPLGFAVFDGSRSRIFRGYTRETGRQTFAALLHKYCCWQRIVTVVPEGQNTQKGVHVLVVGIPPQHQDQQQRIAHELTGVPSGTGVSVHPGTLPDHYAKYDDCSYKAANEHQDILQACFDSVHLLRGPCGRCIYRACKCKLCMP